MGPVRPTVCVREYSLNLANKMLPSDITDNDFKKNPSRIPEICNFLNFKGNKNSIWIYEKGVNIFTVLVNLRENQLKWNGKQKALPSQQSFLILRLTAYSHFFCSLESNPCPWRAMFWLLANNPISVRPK